MSDTPAFELRTYSVGEDNRLGSSLAPTCTYGMCTETYAYKRESTYMCMHKNMQIREYKKFKGSLFSNNF